MKMEPNHNHKGSRWAPIDGSLSFSEHQPGRYVRDFEKIAEKMRP